MIMLPLPPAKCGVAVANALPALKDRADIVTEHDHGAGVIELLEQLLADDLAGYDSGLVRHSVATKLGDSGGAVRINPYRNSLLVSGPSASGKSSAVSGIIEQLAGKKYQSCLIDPEVTTSTLPAPCRLGQPRNARIPAVLKALD
jgi:hypothetical protein